jgi:hypothetical protein
MKHITTKIIATSVLAASMLALGACSSSDTDLIFDETAAERLETDRNDYKEALTADGGLWAMEYFSNSDEPGYVMLFRFDANGSVEISADHIWIGSKFSQETSLWDVISDDGTVLTFDSYNTLFHIFSSPDNITGANAPTNDGSDINESGYGHNGDYEFMLMERSDSMIRLKGKKRGYTVYLRHLDSNTDPKEYLAAVAAKSATISANFPNLVLTDADGATYTVSSLASGIPSVYPNDFNGVEADPVTQTTSGNGIFTLDGFRFASPLTVKHADDTEWEISSFTWAEDGALVNTDEGLRITAPTPAENLLRSTLTWSVDLNSLTGDIATAYQAADAEAKSVLGAKNGLGSVELTWASVDKELTAQLVTKLGTKICRDYITYSTTSASDTQSFTITGQSSTSTKYDEQVPAYAAFKQLLASLTFRLSTDNVISPSTVVMTDANNPTSSLTINLK